MLNVSHGIETSNETKPLGVDRSDGLISVVTAAWGNHGSSNTSGVSIDLRVQLLVEMEGRWGNSKADLEVWPDAGEVIVVNPSRGVLTGLDQEPDILFE